MNADTLLRAVQYYFRENASEFSLEANRTDVSYVLNWGGFVNYSYRVFDDTRVYHLKLTVDEGQRESLRRWYALRNHLEAYHAPKAVAWIELSEAAGILFDAVGGEVPSLQPSLVDAVVPVLQRLNADSELATELEKRGVTGAMNNEHAPYSARDAYVQSFHRRFISDLELIASNPPPFIDNDVLGWMQTEVERLHTAVCSADAFDEILTQPIHGDLWLNNIHWANAHQWYILDWDDLRIGDPAHDIASLLGPSANNMQPLKLVGRVRHMFSPAACARLPQLGRATLLDWIIDPLADWIDAERAPESLALVRSEKQRVHRAAFEFYQSYSYD